MKPYEFYRAESVEAAVASGAAGARDFAGGTNLIDLMKLQVETPGALVDIGRIGLDAVEETDGGVRLGALVPNSDLAAHPSDMAVAMRALDAVVVTIRAGREGRRMPLGELYRLPGDTPEIETILDPGELIVAIELPQPPPGRQLYRKVRDRASYAFALVSVAVALSVEDGTITSARLAFGGLAPKPWRDPAVEAALVGQPAGTAAFEAAADALLAKARGHGHNDFKIVLARRTLIACLRDLAC